jgi:hypothetical protein
MDTLRDKYFVDETTLRIILARIDQIKQQAHDEQTDSDLLAQWLVAKVLN